MVQYAHELRTQMEIFIGSLVDGSTEDSAIGDALLEGIGGYYSEIEILISLCESGLRQQADSDSVGRASSVVKLYYSELAQRFAEYTVAVAGLPAQLQRPVPNRLVRREGADWMLNYLRSWALTIAGGTNEIQRTMIGERMLGLPREPLPAGTP